MGKQQRSHCLVVGCRTVGVHGGEGPGLDDSVPHLLSGEVPERQGAQRNPAAGPGKPSVREVGEHPEVDPSASDLFNQRLDLEEWNKTDRKKEREREKERKRRKRRKWEKRLLSVKFL